MLIVWERGLHEALERAIEELSKVKERCESGHISGIMGYTPMAVPGSKRASRLALSDKEFVTKCIEICDEVYATAQGSYEALSRAFKLILEHARSLIVELKPEDIWYLSLMPIPSLKSRIEDAEESLNILRRHLGDSLREYVFKLPSC